MRDTVVGVAVSHRSSEEEHSRVITNKNMGLTFERKSSDSIAPSNDLCNSLIFTPLATKVFKAT